MHEAVAELRKEGASSAEIDCVESNFKATSEEEMAERILEDAPAAIVEAESEMERLGPLGKGCP